MVAEMGGMAEKQIADAIAALSDRDTVLAKRVIATDRTSTRFSTRSRKRRSSRSRAASRWRSICARSSARMRISNDLERIGDLAKNIGKRVMRWTATSIRSKLMRGVEHMAASCSPSSRTCSTAMPSRDLAKAIAVWHGDEEIDAIYNSLFRELLTYMMEDPRNISFCMHLMFCAKNIERMGDHATNIAETVYYMVEGNPIADERPKGDTTASQRTILRARIECNGDRAWRCHAS